MSGIYEMHYMQAICKHILAHLEDHKILTNLQHGFRSGRSRETQLNHLSGPSSNTQQKMQ